ncbi:MAG: AAA family ATPase [Planctomycetota bacterium]|nr:AAA family ATPase [Planctomycetota bacterium]
MYETGQTSMIVEGSILRESYIPEKLFARETQIQEILRCLSPLQNKRKPINLWLYGPSGAGKTATAIYLLNHLKEKAGIKGILINCWQKDSFYEILDEIISQLRILGAEEHRTSMKLEKLRRYLNNQPFVIVLDEIDQLKPSERSTTLYNLDSLGNVGIICISNSRQPLFELEERVRSRLNPYTVFFPAYFSETLVEILTYRAETALVAGVWSKKALRQIAEMASGDARVAIRTLQATAELAENERLDAISTHTLERQWDNARQAKQDHILKSLTEDHRILYQIVKQRGQILSGDLWVEYLQHCVQAKRKPLASRTFSDYVNRLAQVGLIISERARVKGKVRLFKITATVPVTRLHKGPQSENPNNLLLPYRKCNN